MKNLVIVFGLITILFGIEALPMTKGEVEGINSAPDQMVATMLFGGDMMFDRYIRSVMARRGNGYIFSCLDGKMPSNDLFVANLEGPITDYPSKSVGSIPGGENNFTFTFPTTTPSILKDFGIGLVNIGNNHSRDFGDDGINQTTYYLNKSGIEYFGHVNSLNIARKSINGIDFSFVPYNEFGGDLF